MCCSVLQCVAVCCSVLQCVAMCCSVLQCVAVCCNVLQCVAVCCSVLRCVAVCAAHRLMRRALTPDTFISRKSQVSFAEHRLFYRALLQKRPIILRSLLIEATPYLRHVHTETQHTSFRADRDPNHDFSFFSSSLCCNENRR